MAAADQRDKLSCSLCREIYTDPVTLPCGHNYCLPCIEGTWDRQEGTEEDLTCPECRHIYRERPELNINVTLSSLVQSFLPIAPEQGGPGIYCTYCPKFYRVTACSTCLLCNVSLCYRHAREHSNITQHELTAPTPSQRDRYCPKHPELLLEYYCPQDGVCICASCYRVGEHRDHMVEPMNGETSEKKKVKLREVLVELSPEREETEGQIQRLQESLREVLGEAAGETERVTALFRDIREELEALEKRLLRDISWEQKKVSHKLQLLEIKKDELSRKIWHIEELCNMAAPLTVLQAREPDGAELYGAEGGDRKRRKMEDINAPAVGDLDVGRISETLLTGLDQIVTEAKGRFTWREATDLVLDTEAHDTYVSEDRKTLSCTVGHRYNPRCNIFSIVFRVLCLSTRSFSSGRHYWEVEGSGEKWEVGVTYSNEAMDEDDYDGDRAWNLSIICDTYNVPHRSNNITLTPRPSCGRIRISLDYEAGLVSFYELSEPIRHIYTYTDSFTLPLCAAFWVERGSVRITSMGSAGSRSLGEITS